MIPNKCKGCQFLGWDDGHGHQCESPKDDKDKPECEQNEEE